MKTIYFAGGCFWGVEKFFSLVDGVVSTEVGYANGSTADTTYKQVKETEHAETVKIDYDENQISLTFLIDLFFEIIDPFSLNRQGEDVGVQYRTGIYFVDENDKEIVEGMLILLQESFADKIVVEVLPLKNFCTAEEYHQNYLNKNPNGYCHLGALDFEKAKNAVDVATKNAKKSLKEKLTPLQFEVTQNGATEPPFCNQYWQNFEKGIYVDVTTNQPLFLSTDKFESGCGWPSFSKPIDENLVSQHLDLSHNRTRTEVKAANSNAHLGHLFKDAPKELGGNRYCINSAALRFVPLEKMEEEGFREYIKLLIEENI